MPRRLLMLPLLLALAACNGTRTPSDAPAPSGEEAAAEEPPQNEGSIAGTWERVAQEGYPDGHPGNVPQHLTFYEDGRMTLTTWTDGEPSEHEMTYRLEGDRLVQAMGTGAAVARTSRWELAGDRLVIEQPETGERDVYRRVR